MKEKSDSIEVIFKDWEKILYTMNYLQSKGIL